MCREFQAEDSSQKPPVNENEAQQVKWTKMRIGVSAEQVSSSGLHRVTVSLRPGSGSATSRREQINSQLKTVHLGDEEDGKCAEHAPVGHRFRLGKAECEWDYAGIGHTVNHQRA